MTKGERIAEGVAVTVACIVLAVTISTGHKEDAVAREGGNSRLLVIWTSGDRDVAMKTVFMYTYNAGNRDWWDEVRLLVWGPSAKLLAGDEELQGYLEDMAGAGVELLACRACADMYGVSDTLGDMGIEVAYMGEFLTDMLQSGWTTLTF